MCKPLAFKFSLLKHQGFAIKGILDYLLENILVFFNSFLSLRFA